MGFAICSFNNVVLFSKSINVATLIALNMPILCEVHAIVWLPTELYESLKMRGVTDVFSNMGIDVRSYENPADISLDTDARNCVVSWKVPRRLIGSCWLISTTDTYRRFKGDVVSCRVTKLGNELFIKCGKNVECLDAATVILEPCHNNLEIEALRILQSYQAEFGSLRVSDAVNALALELNLDRMKSRELLSKLVNLGLIRIRRGFVEIL